MCRASGTPLWVEPTAQKFIRRAASTAMSHSKKEAGQSTVGSRFRLRLYDCLEQSRVGTVFLSSVTNSIRDDSHDDPLRHYASQNLFADVLSDQVAPGKGARAIGDEAVALSNRAQLTNNDEYLHDILSLTDTTSATGTISRAAQATETSHSTSRATGAA